ncbi:MAG: reverse transcriptase domain-containing protein [Saezia sp.]
MTSDNDPHWQNAYRWLCKCRQRAPANAQVWHVRFFWRALKESTYRAVQEGRYQLTPMRIYKHAGGDAYAQWSALDALVLKWLALTIEQYLPRHPRCEHLKGHGGSKASIARLAHAITQRPSPMRFVCRTDIKGYYQHIRKEELYGVVCNYVTAPASRALLHQFLHYSVEYGGEFHTPTTGISRGCALSPLLGGVLLDHVDRHFASQPALTYARYMDDFIILTHRRWPLRRAVRDLNRFFNLSGFEQHPDKTYIGRVEHGFDWLGVQLSDLGVISISPRSLEHHRKRCRQLYEQARSKGQTHQQALARVAQYQSRWDIWARGMTAHPDNVVNKMSITVDLYPGDISCSVRTEWLSLSLRPSPTPLSCLAQGSSHSSSQLNKRLECGVSMRDDKIGNIAPATKYQITGPYSGTKGYFEGQIIDEFIVGPTGPTTVEPNAAGGWSYWRMVPGSSHYLGDNKRDYWASAPEKIRVTATEPGPIQLYYFGICGTIDMVDVLQLGVYYKGVIPATVSIAAPRTVELHYVAVGTKKSAPLPITITALSAATATITFQGSPAHGPLTSVLGGGSYQIKLPAAIGGGYADVTGTKPYQISLPAGDTILNTTVELTVPANAATGDQTANLLLTVKQI